MNTNTLPPEDPILAWKAPQHAHVERGPTWYVVAAICVIAMVIYSIWTAAWTFTALIVLLGGLYWRVHKNVPGEKTIRIWKRGFALEDIFYEWKDFSGYWIMKTNHHAELHLEKTNKGEVKIQTGDVNPYLIHEVLTPLLPELADRKEHILDTIIRICKL